MPVTRNGVYTDLLESVYSMQLDCVEYFFSSELYLNKFIEEHEENRCKFAWFLSGKKLDMNFNVLADVSLYRIIEKRGFCVKIEGNEVDWQELRKYATQRLLKNS